jgi:dihydroceramidase
MSAGYWHPHSSSVDFCEPDYALTPYIAEPFNSVSSLYICLIGIVGMLYSNPTREWPFYCLFLIDIFVGLGSFGLHATLHWLPQSFDEIPMLWFDVVSLYILCRIQNVDIKYKPDYLLVIFSVLAVCVTVFYYAFRSYYESFLIMYSTATAIVIFWNGSIVWSKPRDPLILKVWIASIFMYLCVAAIIWVIDMKMCDMLLPYYLQANGLTFHVVWHVAAGLGAHVGVLQFSLLRARALNMRVHIEWVWTVPIIKETINKKS